MDEIWLNLENKPLDKTKRFVRSLFEIDITDKITWFDKLDCSSSLARQDDPEMTLDYYLDNVTESVQIRYIIGKQEYIQNEQIPAISLLLRDRFEDSPTIGRFAWFMCHCNPENFTKIDEIFQETYGMTMSECGRLW